MSSCADFWTSSGAPCSASRRQRSWRRKARSELAATALGLALVLQLPAMAAAALVECPPISNTPGSKVVVDEVRPSGGGAAALSAFEQRRLQNAIHQQIGQLSAERPAEVQAVICRQRWPEGPAEFSPALSRNLLDHNVLIELWGESDQGLALIQYAVLPVRIRAGTHLPGIYASAYSFGASGGIETLFRDARELQAFTALALGFRAFEQARAASGDADEVARSADFNVTLRRRPPLRAW